MTRQTAAIVKDEARALYLQGLKYQAEGRLDDAIAFFDAALSARPDFPEALCSGGYILQSTGHFEGALAFYGRAIELEPDYFDALFNRGCLAFALKRLPEAIDDFRRAAAVTPGDAGAHSNLGAALYQSGELVSAIESLETALRLKPDMLEAILNLGSALRRLGREEEAGEAFWRAALLKPDCAEAFCGLGIVARACGDFDKAMEYYDCALSLDPKLEEAISSKGCLELLLGRFREGWEAYEYRWIDGKRPVPISDARFDPDRPETIAGKRVLIVNDHGLGDTIQFFRYVKLLADNGAAVTFAGPKKMQRLLASSGAAISWCQRGEIDSQFDARIAISSLPRAFETRLETIPATIPYLRAEPERVAIWGRQIRKGNEAQDRLKVGLCWRGSQDFRVDPRRSIPPQALTPLVDAENVDFYALHMDVGADELPQPLAGRIHIFADRFDKGPDAFLDTAAVMAELDLIVTCDTSIAHLAGALGRPTWVMLRHVAEWRWLRDRDDTPWYPTLRLLRAEAGDDWQALSRRIAKDLSQLASERTVR